MKRYLLYIIFFFSSQACFSQSYIPMPSDSAVWRYRIYDIDYLTQVLDNILFLNGQDTIANGYTYHKIMSRTCRQAGAAGFDPPIVTTEATSSDIYYGAMRETGKKVYTLSVSGGEDLIYDFSAGVGDSIPASVGKDRVTAIDSVMIESVYHKRYRTADSTYFVIEGIGSNRGLIPALNDGGGTVFFYCFTGASVTWSPDTTIPCTYIYPVGYVSAISNINDPVEDVVVYPVPVSNVLHVQVSGNAPVHADILTCMGARMWSGTISNSIQVRVDLWARGIYYLRLNDPGSAPAMRKIIVE